MSHNPTIAELAAIRITEIQARLVAQNKEKARAQLLQIQLLLARQAIIPTK